MPISLRTPKSEIDDYIVKCTKRMTQAIIYNLKVIGEKVTNRARITAEKGRDFTDQTGNLRSSIGYVITVDGKVVMESSFNAVKNGGEGAEEGRLFAHRLAQQVPKGFCLIVVAGMNYAKYVAARGFDVLDSAELLAEKLTHQLLSK